MEGLANNLSLTIVGFGFINVYQTQAPRVLKLNHIPLTAIGLIFILVSFSAHGFAYEIVGLLQTATVVIDFFIKNITMK